MAKKSSKRSNDSTKNAQPTLTKIRQILKEATFNPRKAGTMQVVSEVASPEYYEKAATLLIREAGSLRSVSKDSNTDLTRATLKESYDQKITQAIRLLTLARIYTE